MIRLSGQWRASIFFCILCTLKFSDGLECSSSGSFIFGPKQCPGPFDDSDKSFCCEKDGPVYCCDIDDFAKLNTEKYLLPVAGGIVLAILAICFICCLCCPCCMLYKRRHQGTVYGRVQQPTAVVTVQTQGPTPPVIQHHGNMPMTNTMPMPMPMPMPQAGPFPQAGPMPMQPQGAPYPPYQVPGGDYSGQPQMPPPPYSAVTNEGYAKQAPYNPSYYNN